MSKQPSPRADQLRAMREAAYAKSQAAQKAWAAAEAKAKPKPKPAKREELHDLPPTVWSKPHTSRTPPATIFGYLPTDTIVPGETVQMAQERILRERGTEPAKPAA